jgi:hypothetical protein
MTKLKFHNLDVRVWSNCEQPECTLMGFFGPDKRVIEVIEQVINSDENCDVELLREELEKLDHVAAYEIVDSEGQGVVVYPDWK